MSVLLESQKYNQLLSRMKKAIKFLDSHEYSWDVKKAELPKFYAIASEMELCLSKIKTYNKHEIRHGFKVKEV